MNAIGTGWMLGFLGSIHCIGMCGPLMLALPKRPVSRSFLTGRMACQFGRITTYTLAGLVMGSVGGGLAWAGWQQGLSIGFGLFLFSAVFIRHRVPASVLEWAGRRVARLRHAIAPRLKADQPASLFALGVLNGLLPCGLVYVALAGAASTGSTTGGVHLMLGFGLGTMPAMFATSLAGTIMGATVRLRLQRAAPGLLVLLSVCFILRGLGLGIPYLSPELPPVAGATAASCCSHAP